MRQWDQQYIEGAVAEVKTLYLRAKRKATYAGETESISHARGKWEAPHVRRKRAHLIRHPSSLDLKISATNSAQLRFELGLRFYHLDDIGYKKSQHMMVSKRIDARRGNTLRSTKECELS